MDLIRVLILAIVQGIAEFLPISSSGHLVVLDTLFEQLGSELPSDRLTMEIVLHAGTLVAILIVYWQRILLLLSKDRRVIPLVVVGTIPAVVFGVPLKQYCGEALENALLAGFMFLITGGLLLWSRRLTGSLESRDLTYRSALVVGLFQAFAILPGISRSGSTIVGGLRCGLRRDEAAAFSFLLAIPAIGGATLLHIVDLVKDYMEATHPAPMGLDLLAIGAVVSCIVGVIALRWLIKWLEQGRLEWFAYWVFALGPIVIAWQLLSTHAP